MQQLIPDSWAIVFLAVYMTLLSAYAASLQPEGPKKKRLFTLLSIGIIAVMAVFLWNAAAR